MTPGAEEAKAAPPGSAAAGNPGQAILVAPGERGGGWDLPPGAVRSSRSPRRQPGDAVQEASPAASSRAGG